MNDYKVLVCEDIISEQEDIRLFLNSTFRELNEFNLSLDIVDFNDVNKKLEGEYILLILDLYDKSSKDGHKDKGVNVLMRNQATKQIPTLVYTSMGDSIGFDEDLMKTKYPALIKKLTKIHNSYENLTSFVKGYLLSILNENNYYSLYNDYDINLTMSIRNIGGNNFNYILYKIYEKYNKNKIIVYPMTSGLSGAVLFRLEFENKVFILKISAEISKLKEEHQNALELYKEFPCHLTNSINMEEYYSFDNNVLGILIKNVDNSQTFFDFVVDKKTKIEQIENYLSSLYLENQSLEYHFKKKKGKEEDWTSIFNKFDEMKILLIKKSNKELISIIQKFYTKIDIEDFRRLIILKNYQNLNQTALLDKKYKKSLILSHGDFHAKNILVQNGVNPVIIDTGSLGYQHWSLDISRLIVNLFILGIDKDHVDYFDLYKIPQYLDTVEKIIYLKEIDLQEDNKNIVISINWLMSNIKQIYIDSFALFEFQLALMKEFLQISYRFDTIPPNKRALALIASHKCLIEANKNVIN